MNVQSNLKRFHHHVQSSRLQFAVFVRAAHGRKLCDVVSLELSSNTN